jgi:hypothetical protein
LQGIQNPETRSGGFQAGFFEILTLHRYWPIRA